MDLDLPGIAGTFSVGGKANDDGFDLNGANAVGLTWMAGCKEMSRPVTDDRDGVELFVIALLMFAAVAGAFNHLFWPPVLLLGLGWNLGPPGLRWKKWHWVEHQVAYLLENKCAVNREAMRRTSPVSMRCGSALGTLRMLGFVIAVATLDYGRPLFPLCVSYLAASIAVQTPRLDTTRTGRIIRGVLTGLGMPVILATLMFQRLLYVRKPEPAQEELAAMFGAKLAPFIAVHTLQGASILADLQSKRGALSIT